jgi:hypothetical protein
MFFKRILQLTAEKVCNLSDLLGLDKKVQEQVW